MTMTEEKQFQEIIVAVQVHGAQDPSLEQRALEALETARKNQIDKTFARYEQGEQRWNVEAHQTPRQGTGATYTDAIAQTESAYESGAKDEHPVVSVTLEQTFRIPYTLVSAKASGSSKDAMLEALAKDEEALRAKHGDNLSAEPESVDYKVTQYSGKLHKKTQEPTGEKVAVGVSKFDPSEAEQCADEARGKNKAKSAIFEGTHAYRLFEMVAVAAVGAATTAAVAGPTSAYAPVATPATSLF